ncbi:cell wall hydrolase [Azospirillum cavernae]|uniref:Cell wall hydrolase n=1 Tax=Azospirillum cavernae TaxID=2320860 RepID=A0A418VWX0_9PROT|nr:cell wall hydrolase [Azospirillum cavernae]RJF81651.1 cell wall hydrolase [Azospirillum cavernae]
MLGLIAGIVQGAALIYEHWNGIGDFVRGELDKISKADPFRFGVRENDRRKEAAGRFRLAELAAAFQPEISHAGGKPAIAAPQASPPEKSWWRSLFVTPANAAVPPAAAPSAPAVAAPQSTAAALPTAVPPVTVGADTKAITLDPTAVEALTRVAIAEAGNQGAVGLEGVVRTVLNRSAHPAWGGSIPDVVNQRGQFEPVMRAGGDWRNLPSGSSAQRATVQGILDGIASGRRTDPTGGATYFLNRDISERRGTDFGRGRDDLRSAEIGDHSFYKPGVFGEKPTPVPNYSVLLSDLAKAQAEQARAATANPGQPGQQGPQQGQPIQVDVRFSGAVPPGTTASVQGQPDSIFAPTRVNYSTPDFARP